MKHPRHLVAAATLTLLGVTGFAAIASAGTKPSTTTVTSACRSGTVCTSFDLKVVNGNDNIINGLTLEVGGKRSSTSSKPAIRRTCARPRASTTRLAATRSRCRPRRRCWVPAPRRAI